MVNSSANYWIAANALSISLNALGDANRIQCGLATGSVIMCYIRGVDGLEYDNGHNYRRWPLTVSPTYFETDTKKYIYVAIPRTAAGGTVAQVCFPSQKIDIYGYVVDENGAPTNEQIGNDNFYYIWLQGIISEVQTIEGVQKRVFVSPCESGSLATDEATSSTETAWYRYDLVTQIVQFLKEITMSEDSVFSNLRVGGGNNKGNLTGVAFDATVPETSRNLIATPAYVKAVSDDRYLRKDIEDTAAEIIRFMKGLRIGERFTTGPLGEGAIFRMNAEDGKTYLELDKLYVRMKAYFDTVEIRRFLHSGGNRIASIAGVKTVRVEWIKVIDGEETILDQETADPATADFFRCYFRGSDGDETVTNDFVIGDQAYCHITNVVSTSEMYQHHFWRLVIGKSASTNEDGEHYIDLSNATQNTIEGIDYSGYQNDSDIPVEQDDIIQLGNVNDPTRRGAIIEYVSGNDAPSYQIFQNLGAVGTATTIADKQRAQYSLENKNFVSLGYNSATGHAYFNVFGDAYIGAPDRSTFIEYTQGDGTAQNPPSLRIKAHVEFTNTDQELDALVQQHQNNYDDTEVKEAIGDLSDVCQNLQQQIDGSIETLYGEVDPTQPGNDPYADYTTAEKEKHLGDMFYNTLSGYAYRYDKNTQVDPVVYHWTIITDSGITKAIAEAGKALNLAGSKAKIYTTTAGTLPPAPYNVDDVWVNATYPANGSTYSNEILKCVNACPENGVPQISDWTKASKYTDDTYAHNFDYLKDAMKGDTQISGGLLLSNLIVLRNVEGGQSTDVMSGISGVIDARLEDPLKTIASWYGGDRVDLENLESYWNQEQINTWNNMTPAQQAISNLVAKTLFRFDGSGYMASGNITWNRPGAMTIKNLETIYGTTTGVSVSINTLSTLQNIFHTETYGEGELTELLVKPQNAFSQLFINRSETPNNPSAYPQDHSLNDYAVLNRMEMDDRYVTKAFFNALFTALDSNDDPIDVNDASVEDLLDSIKANVGFWTEEYLTAYGEGGGTAPVVLNEPLSSINNENLGIPTVAGQTLVWNGTHWTYGTSGSTYSAMTAQEISAGISTTSRVITSKVLNDWLNSKPFAINPLLIDNLTLSSTFKANDAVAINGTIYRCKTTTSKFVFTPVVQDNKMLYNALNGYRSYIFTDLSMDSDWEVWLDTGTGYELEKLRVGLAAANTRIDNLNGVTMAQVQSWVNSQNYATQSWVTSRGYITSSALVGYATETWVTNKGYITSSALVGYATQTWVSQNFNNYSLPLAESGTRGGVQIGFTTDATNRNYAVQLSNEKMYVNVPWENTTYTDGTGLSLSSGVFSISSTYQTYISHGESAYNALGNYLPLTGGTITGNLTVNQLFSCQDISIGHTNEINSSSSLYLQYRSSGDIYMANGGGNVGIGTSSPVAKLHVAGSVYAVTGFWSDGYMASYGEYSSSDIHQKDIHEYGVDLDIAAIANAPVIRFTWKEKKHLGMQVGSIAQYWKEKLPDSVRMTPNNTLMMQYGVIALISVVTTAKKVVDHEKRLQTMERKCKNLEDSCQILERTNKELLHNYELLKRENEILKNRIA